MGLARRPGPRQLLFPSPFAGPEPALATDVERLNELTWEVTVREGVRWHDGTEFSADDVAFSLELYRDGPHSRNAHHANQVPSFEDAAVPEAGVVRVETSYPTPTSPTRASRRPSATRRSSRASTCR